jgi:hypothetical protein
MAEQIGLNWTDPNSVRKAIKVEAPREIAWQTFTEQMRTWWPLAVTRSVRQTRSVLSSNHISAVAGRWTGLIFRRLSPCGQEAFARLLRPVERLYVVVHWCDCGSRHSPLR